MGKTKLFPVSYERYWKSRWKRFKSYHFARNICECSVVLEEILPTSAAFPVIFRKRQDEVEPVAIFSIFETQETPFVSEDGRWLAAYIPSELRCPPFHLLDQSGDPASEKEFCVDEASGFVSESVDGEPFFDCHGNLSVELKRVKSFLTTRLDCLHSTKALCHLLFTMGILEAADQVNGIQLPQGSLIASEGHLNSLLGHEKSNLQQTGALKLVYAHLVSLSHLKWLHSVQSSMCDTSIKEKYTKNSDVSDFLTAIANAQDEYSFEPVGT